MVVVVAVKNKNQQTRFAENPKTGGGGVAGSADPLTVKLGLGGPVTTLYNMGREGDEILC